MIPEVLVNKLAAAKIRAVGGRNYDIINLIDNLIFIPNLQAPAATDGKVVYIGEDLGRYSAEEIFFILNHELDHIYYRHFNRIAHRNGREAQLSNIATDLIINEILTTRDGLPTPADGITRKKIEQQIGKRIRGRNSNEVYEELLEYLDELADEEMKSNGDSDEEGAEGEGNASGDNDNDNESDDNDNDGDSSSKSGSKSKSDEKSDLEKLLGSEADAYEEKLENEAKAREQIEAAQKDLDPELQKQVQEAIRTLVGKLRTDVQTQAESRRDYKPQEIPWTKMIDRFLGRHLKRAETRNIRRPSNRYREILPSSVVVPSNRGYVLTPKINVYLDVSGSMSGVIVNVREVLEAAKRHFKKYKGKYYEFDTEVYEFTRNEFFKQSGATGGGTDIAKVIGHFRMDRTADLAIIITDAEDSAAEFDAQLSTINKPLLLVTDNTRVKTNNKKVTLVITDFK